MYVGYASSLPGEEVRGNSICTAYVRCEWTKQFQEGAHAVPFHNLQHEESHGAHVGNAYLVLCEARRTSIFDELG